VALAFSATDLVFNYHFVTFPPVSESRATLLFLYSNSTYALQLFGKTPGKQGLIKQPKSVAFAVKMILRSARSYHQLMLPSPEAAFGIPAEQED